MQRSWLSVALVLFAYSEANAACDGVQFRAPPPAAKTLVVGRIEGQAFFSTGVAGGLGAVTEVCVVVFDAATHRRVALGSTGSRGEFSLPVASSKALVLVATKEGGSDICAPLRLAPDKSRYTNRGILLHIHRVGDAEPSSIEPLGNLALRAELLALYEQDQSIRYELIRIGIEKPDEEILGREAVIDGKSSARLKEIVTVHGWPGRSLVGVDGMEIASTLLAHASPQIKKDLFPAAERAYRNGDMMGRDFAALTDAILVGDGKPQRYGSNFRSIKQCQGDAIQFTPIEDEANVDRRRAEMGMQPLAEYREEARQLYCP